ncbi:MAG: LTA synthase family protein, partial [Agathobacter sp.]|nr:LTA synthase family protein [Agathobacter sp.]
MKRSLFDKIVNSIWFFFVPIALFYIMEAYEHNAFVEVRPLAQFYNIFLLELIGVFLLFVIGNAKWALRIEIVFALVFGLVNHYVMAFRSTPFVPWDLFSIRTAASVAGNYDFTPTLEVIVVTLLLAALFVVVRFIDLQIPRKVLWRIVPVGCVAILLVGFVNLLQDKSFQTRSYLYPHLFTPA